MEYYQSFNVWGYAEWPTLDKPLTNTRQAFRVFLPLVYQTEFLFTDHFNKSLLAIITNKDHFYSRDVKFREPHRIFRIDFQTVSVKVELEERKLDSYSWILTKKNKGECMTITPGHAMLIK